VVKVYFGAVFAAIGEQCDFPEAQLVKESKLDDETLLRWQLGDTRRDSIPHFGGDEPASFERMRECGQILELSDGRFLCGTSDMVQGQINRNTMQPRPKRGFATKLTKLLECVQECSLCYVFSVFMTPYITSAKSRDRIAMLYDQRVECVLVSLEGAVDQKRVGINARRRAFIVHIVYMLLHLCAIVV
jgi:hypothetical protein